MSRMKMQFVIATGLCLMSACSMQSGPKETGGALIGGAAGGLAGSQFGSGSGRAAMSGLGVLLGAVMGSDVGRSLDRADQITMERSTQMALEHGKTGTVSEWRNPDSGNFGTVRPLQTWRTSSREFCREYQQTVTVGGRTEQAYGTACRQPDGSWEIAS